MCAVEGTRNPTIETVLTRQFELQNGVRRIDSAVRQIREITENPKVASYQVGGWTDNARVARSLAIIIGMHDRIVRDWNLEGLLTGESVVASDFSRQEMPPGMFPNCKRVHRPADWPPKIPLTEIEALKQAVSILREELAAAQVGEEVPREKAARSTRKTGNRKHNRAAWVANAMLRVKDEPDLSDAEIARRVDVSKTALSRCPEYKRAAAMARGEKTALPVGYLTKDPETGQTDVEASARPVSKPESTPARIPESKYVPATCRECHEPIRIKPDADPAQALCERCEKE